MNTRSVMNMICIIVAKNSIKYDMELLIIANI